MELFKLYSEMRILIFLILICLGCFGGLFYSLEKGGTYTIFILFIITLCLSIGFFLIKDFRYLGSFVLTFSISLLLSLGIGIYMMNNQSNNANAKIRNVKNVVANYVEDHNKVPDRIDSLIPNYISKTPNVRIGLFNRELNVYVKNGDYYLVGWRYEQGVHLYDSKENVYKGY